MNMPTGIPAAIETSFTVVEKGVETATGMITGNWVVFLGFTMAIVSIGVGFLKKFKRM